MKEKRNILRSINRAQHPELPLNSENHNLVVKSDVTSRVWAQTPLQVYKSNDPGRITES